MANGRVAYGSAHPLQPYFAYGGCNPIQRTPYRKRPDRKFDQGIPGDGGPAGHRGHPCHARQAPEGALRVVIVFPQCWQGGNNPEDVVYREEEFCQSGEQQIPNFRLSVDFLPKDGRLDKPLEVSAGDGQWELASFMHADRMEGNGGDGDGGETNRFEQLVQDCVLEMEKGPEQPPLYCFPH